MSLLSRLRLNESGNAAIEFAAIGSVLICLTIGLFELGRIAHTQHRLSTAAGVAIRMVGMGATEDEIRASIREALLPTERGALTVIFREVPPDAQGLRYTQVVSQIDLPLIIPGFNLFQGISEGRIAVRDVQMILRN